MSDVGIEGIVWNCAWVHWAQDSKKSQGVPPMYLASRRQLSYTTSFKRVVSWIIYEMQPVLQIFTIFRLCHLMWEKLPGSSHFSVLETMESGAGPGYEVTHEGIKHNMSIALVSWCNGIASASCCYSNISVWLSPVTYNTSMILLE